MGKGYERDMQRMCKGHVRDMYSGTWKGYVGDIIRDILETCMKKGADQHLI
jgi:hypothetical protein